MSNKKPLLFALGELAKFPLPRCLPRCEVEVDQHG